MASPSINKYPDKHSEELDFVKILAEVVDHYKLILITSLISSAIAILHIVFATPIYQADALIQVEQKQRNTILNNLSEMLPNQQLASAAEIALLKSRMILGKTVDDLNLQAEINQNDFPLVGKGWARIIGARPSVLTVSHIYISDADYTPEEITLEKLAGQNFTLTFRNLSYQGQVGKKLNFASLSIVISELHAQPGTLFTIKYVSKLDAMGKLTKNLNIIDQGKDTGILKLTLNDNDRVRAEKILRSISNNYIEQNIAREAAQNSSSLIFLEKQLPEVRQKLDDSENNLSEYRKRSDSVDLNLQAKSTLEQIVNVDNQINQITFREAEISQLFTHDHPVYKALMEKRQTLNEEKEKLNKQVSMMPATQQQLLRLSRDVESGRAIYMQLLNRQQELKIAKNSAIGNVRIIDNAVTAIEPVKPNKKLIVFIGIMSGIISSLGYIVLSSLLRRGISSAEQLEAVGINVYASIPKSEVMRASASKSFSVKNKREINLYYLARENPADITIEALRGLRTSLHFAMLEAKKNVLMITGVSPNAGKSFISSNLAALLAQAGQKILLIDGDMRKGYLNRVFNINSELGLADILSGKMEIKQSVSRVTDKNFEFDFISSGTVPPNPVELLMHHRFAELIDWSAENYDLILIDSPPILAVTDAALIGQLVGSTLIVARYADNTVKEIEVGIRRFEQAGVKVKGCILNGVIQNSKSYYCYGYKL